MVVPRADDTVALTSCRRVSSSVACAAAKVLLETAIPSPSCIRSRRDWLPAGAPTRTDAAAVRGPGPHRDRSDPTSPVDAGIGPRAGDLARLSRARRGAASVGPSERPGTYPTRSYIRRAE